MLDNPLWFLLIVILVIVIFILIAAFITDRVCEPLLDKITSLGYDSKDVHVFLRRIDASLEDFLDSPGLRKQYESFSKGETTDFIRTAESNKKSKDARIEGQAAGMATGIAVGVAAGR